MGYEYASSWKYLMVGVPFWVPCRKTQVSYAAGNPMGAYSSWSSFALTHHYLLYVVCRRLNLGWRDADYVLLGDDIVINNNKIAEEYKKILLELGVEISVGKTHKSQYFYEFAKRVHFNHNDITPFPFNALWENRKRPMGLIADLIDIDNKG